MIVWKSIPNWPNYEVSNTGLVRSIDRLEPFKGGLRVRKGRIMKPKKLNYLSVELKDVGRKQTMLIHRAVALCFVDNPNTNEFNIVNHKDGDRYNNSHENLEWCTQRMNIEHAMTLNSWTRGENHGCSKLTENDILNIRNLLKSSREIASIYGISKTNVLRIKNGRIWKHVA